jgi:hypothetical protein
MKHSTLRWLSSAGGLAALLVSLPASADPVAGIWVDVQPWTCASELGPFGRHVQLACDSLGGSCEVARTEKQAAFRAALVCGEADAWTLELHKADGSEVLSLALEGDREQRLRMAAMWAAHASVGEPPPPKTRRSAPATPAPPADESEPDPPALPVVIAPPQPPLEVRALRGDAIQAAPVARGARGGLTLSGFAGAAAGTGGGDLLAGGRVAAGFPLGAGFYLGPAFNYARSVDHGALSGLYLGGVALALGAPFGGRWLGASLEGGGGASAGGSLEGADVMARPGGRLMERAHENPAGGAGYARAALTLQAPLDFALRPSLSVAAMHVTDTHGQSNELAMLDLGFAWQAW